MAEIIRTMVDYEGVDGKVAAYLSRPREGGARPAVLVIHDIFGLSDHFKDIADRFAALGYVAFVPHLFDRPGMTEAMNPENVAAMFRFNNSLPREKTSDPAYRQQELSKLPADVRDGIQKASAFMMGGMPKDAMTQDLSQAVDTLNAQDFVQTGKVGSVGFCFGGGMSINLACHADLDAAVVFYGENPNPIDLVERIPCPVMGLYGAEDLRINTRLDELVKAMATYKKDFEMRIYPGAGHAFFKDVDPGVYREAQAKDAWARVLRFFERTLV